MRFWRSRGMRLFLVILVLLMSGSAYQLHLVRERDRLIDRYTADQVIDTFDTRPDWVDALYLAHWLPRLSTRNVANGYFHSHEEFATVNDQLGLEKASLLALFNVAEGERTLSRLDELPNLLHLQLGDVSLSPESHFACPVPLCLETIYADGVQFNREFFDRFTRLPNLRAVRLIDTNLSDHMLQQILTTPLLKFVEIHSARELTEDSLISLCRSAQGYLDLRGMVLSDEALLALASNGKLTEIQLVDIGRSEIPFPVMEGLARNPGLTTFVTDARVPVEAFPLIEKMPAIKKLGLLSNQLPLAKLWRTVAIPWVNVLVLSGPQLTAENLAFLSKASKIGGVELVGIPDNLEFPPVFPQVQKLTVVDTELTESQARFFVNSGAVSINATRTKFPPGALRSIQGTIWMELDQITMTDADWSSLPVIPSLRGLSLRNMALDEFHLEQLQQCGNLKVISLYRSKVPSNAYSELAKSIPRLITLE